MKATVSLTSALGFPPRTLAPRRASSTTMALMPRASAAGCAPRLGGAANPLAPAAAAPRRPAPRRACRSAGALGVRAMVNVDISPSVVLGVGLIGAGVSLWQIRRWAAEVGSSSAMLLNCCCHTACTCMIGPKSQRCSFPVSPVALWLPPLCLPASSCLGRMPSLAPVRSRLPPRLSCAPDADPCSTEPLTVPLPPASPCRVKPWLSKDYDVVVSCISLLVGGILIFQVRHAGMRPWLGAQGFRQAAPS